MSTDPTTLPGADGHQTAADHFRTAEMHAASALGLVRSTHPNSGQQFDRHMQLAVFHGQMAATLVGAVDLVEDPSRRPEILGWTEFFRDRAKRAEERSTSRVRGLPS